MLPRSWAPSDNTDTPPLIPLATGGSCTIHMGDESNHGGSFMNKPVRGWLHPDQKITESGICYGVRYLGCLEVNTSMKSLDFDTRSLVAKECISRLCEAAGLKTIDKKRKVDKRLTRMLAEKPNMDYAGSNVSLTITSSKLNLVAMESGEMIANHDMPNISFASGGDSDTLDFVSYVAKDNRYGRACFVLECGGGLAQDVITTIGQAFELRYKQFLKRTPSISSNPDTNGARACLPNGTVLGLREDPDYYNDLPGKVPPDVVAEPESSATKTSIKEGSDNKSNYASVAKVDQNQNPQVSEATAASNTDVTESLIDFAVEVTQVSATYRRPEPEYVNTTAVIFNERLMNYAMANNKNVKKDIFDMQPLTCSLANSLTEEITPLIPSITTSAASPVNVLENSLLNNNNNTLLRNLDSSVIEKIKSSLAGEPWYHGAISRQESETLVIRDGDFLVRESQGSVGQYVLTGMQGGQQKHLLLVDPEGIIRTKDHIFENISHLISHHMNNSLPIVSAESALLLRTPIYKLRPVGKSIHV